MPEITPILPESTITIQANTQTPSSKLASQLAQQTQAQANTQQAPMKPEPTGSEIGEKKAQIEPEHSDKELKARLFLEKTKRSIEADRKKIADERRALELEKIQTRKWFETEELVRQGRLVEAAEKAGITYDQLTQQILNNGQIPVAQVAEKTASELVDKKFEEYKKHMEAQAKASQQKLYNDSMKQMESEVKYLVDSSDKYPLVKHAGSYNDIVKFIESEFHRTGRMLSVEEAVQRWEDDVLEGLQELAKLDKVRNNVFKDQSPKPTQDKSPNTISQKTMASVPSPKSMTETERKQRAIDAFYGRLT